MAFLASSQVMLTVLVHRPHWEPLSGVEYGPVASGRRQTNLGPQLETILSILWKATGAQKEVQRERNSFCPQVTGCPEVEKGQGRRFQAEDGKGDLWQMSINGL